NSRSAEAGSRKVSVPRDRRTPCGVRAYSWGRPRALIPAAPRARKAPPIVHGKAARPASGQPSRTCRTTGATRGAPSAARRGVPAPARPSADATALPPPLAGRPPESGGWGRMPGMGEVFTHRLRVRYSECDQQGVVFNGHYLFFYDVALTEMWRELVGEYGQ